MSWKTISYTPASIGITKFFNTDHDDDKNDLELLGKLEYNLDPDTDLDKKEIESLKYTVDGTAYFYLSDINKKRANCLGKTKTGRSNVDMIVNIPKFEDGKLLADYQRVGISNDIVDDNFYDPNDKGTRMNNDKCYKFYKRYCAFLEKVDPASDIFKKDCACLKNYIKLLGENSTYSLGHPACLKVVGEGDAYIPPNDRGQNLTICNQQIDAKALAGQNVSFDNFKQSCGTDSPLAKSFNEPPVTPPVVTPPVVTPSVTPSVTPPVVIQPDTPTTYSKTGGINQIILFGLILFIAILLYKYIKNH